MVTVARRVKAWRKAAGLTVPEFAGRLGYTAPAVYQWESGTSEPTHVSIAKIVKVCGITLSAFWGELPKVKAS